MGDELLMQLVFFDAVLLGELIVVCGQFGAVVFRFLLGDDLAQFFNLQTLLLDSAHGLCLFKHLLLFDEFTFAL